jgi:ribosomal protein L18E
MDDVDDTDDKIVVKGKVLDSEIQINSKAAC